MRQRWILTAALCPIVVGLVTFALDAAPFRGICKQIRSACLEAGFVPGGGKTGYGLKRDCINPIMQGTIAPGANLPLPRVSPRLVAACRTSDPAFGQRGWSRHARNATQVAQSNAALNRGEQPASASAPPRDISPHTAIGRSPAPAIAQSAPPATAPAQPAPPATKRPNIVFVLTDDLSTDLLQYMPHVLAMQKEGATFANYFVTDSLCCPSRASIFSGRYPHDTGIFRNKGADGGYLAFHNRGEERATFATALAASGYRTAMLGKYLNRYRPETNPPAPGWTTWNVAGNAYREFNYTINEDGKVIQYDGSPSDYLTDVLSDHAVRFIKQSAGKPFLIEIATFAPHRPYTPAPRDANAFPGLRAPRMPAFNAAPDANAVRWLRPFPPLSSQDIAVIDREYRLRAQSVLAVDKMIGELQAAVAAIGEQSNTYFVFSSDNGYHMGEHRMMPGKMTAYDMDIRVPLIVTGPRVPAGLVVNEIAQNIDLCPTFAELGGATAPDNVDGRSLVPLLQGQMVADWRTVALVEHHGPVLKDRQDPDAYDSDEKNPQEFGSRSRKPGKYGFRNGNPNSYEAIRASTWVYVEYADGEEEYHDLASDPDELRNSYSSLADSQKASLHATLLAVQNCHDARTCQIAERVIHSARQQ
jgi:N-acetylglucosamine-6-sulfatase